MTPKLISFQNGDIVIQSTTESYLDLSENDNSVVKFINQTCSISGNTILSSTIIPNGNNEVPQWVVNNASKMELQMQVPSVQSDTSYSFQIKTTYGSKYSDFKLINLQVKDWLCANCYIWTSDPNSCKQWISGYKISNQNKTCILDSLESSLKSTQTTLQVAVGINTFFGAILSALNLSSTQIVWSSINQSQLYLLIPMLNIFIQAEVLLFLEGFNFSLLSLSFLKLENIDFVRKMLSVFSEMK